MTGASKAARGAPPAPEAAPELYRYRTRVFYSLAVVGALGLLPFAINNFLQGRPWLGITSALVVIGFFANAIATRRRRRLPVPPAVLLLPAMVALPLSVHEQGIIGVLWTYPAMVLFHFVLDRWVANAFNVGLLLIIALLLPRFAEPQLSVRIVVTLLLTILFTNIFSAIVGGLQSSLHDLAMHDPLTGTFNRRHLAFCLEQARERKSRSGAAAALVALDVDHFKSINDEQGHAQGDLVLCRLVETLQDRMRKVDLLFRSGGEEFLLLLADAELAGARALAEELRRAIAAAALLPGRTVTASFGVAELAAGESTDRWLLRCDHALYAAKAAGRNCVVSESAGQSSQPAAATSK